MWTGSRAFVPKGLKDSAWGFDRVLTQVRLSDTPDGEAFGFKRLPDLGDLVALDLDGPIFHRTTGAARGAQLLSRFLDL